MNERNACSMWVLCSFEKHIVGIVALARILQRYHHHQRLQAVLACQDTTVEQHIGKCPSTKYPASMRRRWYYKYFFALLLGIYTVARAEDKMKINLSAKRLESDIINGVPCQKLTGEVVFVLEKFTIQADNAIYYDKKKLIEAQSHVQITHEDGSTIVADWLVYEEDSHVAKLRGHVVYESGVTTFYTDYFDYDMETQQGHFVQGGKLIEGDNVLTSESGQYNDLEKAATFSQKVTLVNKDYTLQCDTLYYSTVTKIARFEGTTKITSQDGKHTLTTRERGEYNTSSQQSIFAQSTVDTEGYTLYGDLIRVDKAEEVYTATGHVKLIAREDDIIISGDYGQYKKEEGIAEVFGNALMTKRLEEDALYLSADTFVATRNKSAKDSTDNIIVRACHNVKIYKEDLQGKADSMVYQGADATIYFYGDPIFWSNTNQLTADTVHITLQGKTFHEMHMNTHAFVASEDAWGNYNQLQGRTMVAFFKENKIDSIEIDGNAESIYFVVANNGQLQGMNHLRCSQIRMNIEGDSIADITFRRKPTGVFYPPHKIEETVKKLEHFNWRIAERPTKKEVIANGYGMRKTYEKFKLSPEQGD
jgi:lipopolysaccharide export system protein LptA